MSTPPRKRIRRWLIRITLGVVVVLLLTVAVLRLRFNGAPLADKIASTIGAGMRGTQLAVIAQQHLPRLVVLLMSGYSAELLKADRDAPASWELLRKPFTRDELAVSISKLIAARGAP